MDSNNDLLMFLDLLDLDEEIIDARLKSLMVRSSYSNKHLKNAIHLLTYKQLINLQEGTECQNDDECDFVAKLIRDVHPGNVGCVCRITNIVLSLNTTTLVSKSEHLLQQILSSLDFGTTENDKDAINDGKEKDQTSINLLHIQICDSILDAVIESGEIMSLPFLEIPLLRNIIYSSDEKLRTHFFTYTVPRLFKGVTDYNILDKIWNTLKQIESDRNEIAIKVLCTLSDYYLPTTNNKENGKFTSEIVLQSKFWNIILFGLKLNDCTLRKMSVYLARTAILTVSILNQNFKVKSDTETIIVWDHKNDSQLKLLWNNFFMLMETLEEKQSNIVLPSLQLFEIIKVIGDCWLDCAFNLGLKHDNAQVRMKCIEYKQRNKIRSEIEATLLLEALNFINLYDNPREHEKFGAQMLQMFKDINTFIYIFKAIPQVNWAPVPLFNLSKILANVNLNDFVLNMEHAEITQTISDILKIPCNNVVIRRAVQINLSHFVGNNCKSLNWKELITIYPLFQIGSILSLKRSNPLVSLIRCLKLENNDEKKSFFKLTTANYKTVEITILYLNSNQEDTSLFIEIIQEMIAQIQNIVSRQYSNKTECLNEVIILMHLLLIENCIPIILKEILVKEYKSLLQYILNLLSSDEPLSIEKLILVFTKFSTLTKTLICDDYLKEHLLHLYKMSLEILIKNHNSLERRIFSIYLISSIIRNPSMNVYYKYEIINIKDFLKLMIQFEGETKRDTSGKSRNIFYEKSCEVLYNLLQNEHEHDINKYLKELTNYIEIIIECGGYGCLKWILKTINKLIPLLLENKEVKFNINHIIDRMWKEIEEQKSNNQYIICIKEFIHLITQDALLNKAIYNNTLLVYYNKILEYSETKNSLLYYLMKTLNEKNIDLDYGPIVHVLTDILLSSPLPRKDQRIAENATLDILNNTKYDISLNNTEIHFDFQIKYLSISTLSKIDDPTVINTIASLIMNKIDYIFKNKQRYHHNSHHHRVLLTALQHLLFIVLLKSKNVDLEGTYNWSVNFLGKLPHQPSARICFEWLIALYLYVKKVNINADLLHSLHTKNISLTSQFVIFYWVLKHKVIQKTHTEEEFNFIMDTLLAHTMGQTFNIRLHTQYLATKLYQIIIDKPKKYDYIIEVVNTTLTNSSTDKNLVKLQKDYFINEFDFISHLVPSFVYCALPKHCEITCNNMNDLNFIQNIINDLDECAKKNIDDDFKKEWMSCFTRNEDIFSFKMDKDVSSDNNAESVDFIATIQKKYVPPRTTSDLDINNVGKKNENRSELIVVASLIDKLPNLGGMARTGEVFGVKTYVVDSLRHLQDKQFQGLSVSAERWIDIEEVRPGPPLKEYLMKKKSQGYSVVAAEQTSTSSPLQTFKFPKKTLLLLGHEKEGVPCDLLQLMDYCVEIPQRGYVRSLNVHVTAAIFVWEYSRQNIL